MSRDADPHDWVLVFRPTTVLEATEAREALLAAQIEVRATWRPSAVASWFPGRVSLGRTGGHEGDGELWVERGHAERAVAALRALDAEAQARIRGHLVGFSHDLRRIALALLALALLTLLLRGARVGPLFWSLAAAFFLLAALELLHLRRRRKAWRGRHE